MTRIPLSVSAMATFTDDGQGGTVARASLAPTVFGTQWFIKRVVISTTSNADVASRFYMYRNSESPANMVDGSYDGDQDTNETDIFLNTLDTLLFRWEGGSLGSLATVVLGGEMETGRPY